MENGISKFTLIAKKIWNTAAKNESEYSKALEFKIEF